MCALLALFVLVPIAELALLLRIGEHVGVGPTMGLILVTGVLGATLARRQGLAVLQRMREETAAGRLPAESVFDGALILFAGAVLLTPGVLTDAFGFLCLVPAFRRRLQAFLRARYASAVREGRVRVQFHSMGGFQGDGPTNRPGIDPRVVDVEARELDEPDSSSERPS